MLKLLTRFALLSFLICQSGLAFAGSSGIRAAEILNLEIGAQPLGMGGAFTAAGGGIHSLGFNPAGLADLESLQATAMYRSWLLDTRYSYAALALPLEQGSFSANILSFGGKELTRIDTQANVIGKFQTSSFALGVGFARQINAKINLGFLGKLFHERLDTEKASGFAADFGVLYRLSSILALGFSAQNVGPSIRFRNISEPISMTFRTGMQVKPPNKTLRGSLDMLLRLSSDPEIRVGIEYLVAKNIQLRGGYAIETGSNLGASGPSLGLGFGFQVIKADYAATLSQDFGMIHVLNITFIRQRLSGI